VIAPLSVSRGAWDDSSPVARVPRSSRDRAAFPKPGSAIRIREVFGLPRECPLPPVDAESLARYGRYLETRLEFPLDAGVFDAIEGELLAASATVTRLVSGEPTARLGLECAVQACGGTVHLSVSDLRPHDPAQRQLVDDYRYWLRSCQAPANGG